MANVNVKILGKELKNIKKMKEVLDRYSKSYVKVGLFGGNHSSNGESLVKIGALHEFGSITPRTINYKGKKITLSGIPTRSWLRMPLKSRRLRLLGENREHREIVFRQTVLQEIDHGYTGVLLKFLAENAKKVIDDAFETQGFGKWKPNINKEYVKLKGSDTPLIDTGELRRSVTAEIVNG